MSTLGHGKQSQNRAGKKKEIERGGISFFSGSWEAGRCYGIVILVHLVCGMPRKWGATDVGHAPHYSGASHGIPYLASFR